MSRACLCDVRRLYDRFTSLFISKRSCMFDLIVLQDHNLCVAFMCVLARFYLRVFINTGAEMEPHESLFPPAVGQSLP